MKYFKQNSQQPTKPPRHETYSAHSAKDIETAKLLLFGAAIGATSIIIGTLIDFLCN